MSTKIVDGFSGDLIEPDFSGLDFKFSRMEKAAARDALSLEECIAAVKASLGDHGECLKLGVGTPVYVTTLPSWYVKFLQRTADVSALASNSDDALTLWHDFQSSTPPASGEYELQIEEDGGIADYSWWATYVVGTGWRGMSSQRQDAILPVHTDRDPEPDDMRRCIAWRSAGASRTA